MDINQMQKALARFRHDRAPRGLLEFTKLTKPDYRVNWHHEQLAAKLDRVAMGLCRRLMIFMPPQHGKSELVSRRFPAYVLGLDPDKRLIAASHTHDLAANMNRDVQRIIAGDVYEKLFPETRLKGSPFRLPHAAGVPPARR